jgi:hypothetical protein
MLNFTGCTMADVPAILETIVAAIGKS